MPTIDIPNDVYEDLQRRAASRQRAASEEAILLLREALCIREANPPLPEFVPSEEFSPPFDLPMPGPGVEVKAVWGPPPRPDPIELPGEET